MPRRRKTAPNNRISHKNVVGCVGVGGALLKTVKTSLERHFTGRHREREEEREQHGEEQLRAR